MRSTREELALISEWRRGMLHIAVVLIEACALGGHEHMTALACDWAATANKLKELTLLMPEPPA